MALLCLCEGVSERKIRKAVADGAASISAIGDACGAGTHCHGCHPSLDDVLHETRVGVAPRQFAWP